MTYEEWIESPDTTTRPLLSEAFEAGRESYRAEIVKIWEETKAMNEFAEDVAGHIGVM